MQAIIPAQSPFAARIAALSARERLLLGIGTIAVLLFLLFMLLPRDAPVEEEAVELAQPAAGVAASQSINLAPPPAAPVSAAPPASAEGLVLHGVLGGGPGGGAAILGFPGGGQRAIRVGREFMPGLTLKAVGLRHVVITTSGGDMRLEFNKAAEAVAATAPAAVGGEAEARRRETVQFRLGLEPRQRDGRIAGFAVRAGSEMPLLRRAGLQPGDVITKVNGTAFRSNEKVTELSQELATSYTAKIEFVRDGKPMTAQLEMNKRDR